MRFLGNLMLLVVGLVLGLALSELAVRLFVPATPLDGTNLVYQIDSSIGWKYAPNQVGMKQSSCYVTEPVTTNAFGFRDDTPWQDGQIALMGDSFVAAAEVDDATYLGKQLERILGVGVMNAASAQGYSTIQEYRVFKEYVAKYHPKTVVLLFFLGNDVWGNGCETHTFDLPQNYRLSPCGTVEPDGSITIKEPKVETKDLMALNNFPSLKVFLKRTCRTCTLAWQQLQGYFRTENVRHGTDATRVDIEVPGASVQYADIIDHSWTVTAEYLKKYDDAVKEAGGTLVVAALPDLVTLNAYWNKVAKGELAPGAPVPWERYATPERLQKIVAEEPDVYYLDLLLLLVEYQREHTLPTPYYSYSCDLHFSPLGHEVVAGMIASYLTAQGLVDVD